MINKQGLWFLTLFSLILVLSVYYITMPNELLLSTNGSYTDKTKETTKEEDDTKKVTKNETLEAMRVDLDESRQATILELQSKLTSTTTKTEEKNNIYEQLQYITKLKTEEEKLEKKLEDSKKLESFIKIDNKNVEVVVASKEHNTLLAVEIMKLIQEEFTEKMYISVKFEV
jgi:stage III sporulation protein AH